MGIPAGHAVDGSVLPSRQQHFRDVILLRILLVLLGVILSLPSGVRLALADGPGPMLFEKPRAFRELTSPRMKAPQSHSTPQSDELVVGCITASCQMAIPLRVIGEHRIVNIENPEGVVLTWDADAGTARAFVAACDDQELTFRFQGWYLGVMVMRDAETGSLWSSLTGTAIAGPLRGSELETVAIWVMSWQKWQSLYPTTILPDLPLTTNYKTTYPLKSLQLSADAKRSLGKRDDRLDADARVIGVNIGGRVRAFPLEDWEGCRLEQVAGRDILLWQSKEGTVMAYSARLAGETIELSDDPSENPDRIRTKNGDEFDLTGRQISGKRPGIRLKPLDTVVTKWYAWSAYYPQSPIKDHNGGTEGPIASVLLPAPQWTTPKERAQSLRTTRKERRDARRKGTPRTKDP